MDLMRVCKRRALLVCSSLLLVATVFYMCLYVSKPSVSLAVVHDIASGTGLSTVTTVGSVEEIHRLDFDPQGQDSLVFVHIQKTGGSNFLQLLVTLRKNHTSLCVSDPSHSSRKKDRYICPRKPGVLKDQWLISEKTMGWVCGLHALYSEFLYCLQRNHTQRVITSSSQLHFMTMLRHPVVRYLSEYLHVQRGASWSTRHKCNGLEVTDAEMPPCYPGYYNYHQEPWSNVTFEEFISCDSNWANNRQTMTLASLGTAGCFKQGPQRGKLLLESAKDNLLDFAFFGITEYFNESCLLFEHMIGLEFGVVPEQRSASQLHSAPVLQKLWSNKDTYQKIAHANSLDMELYEFALKVFSRRMQAIGVQLDEQKLSKEIAEITFADVSIKKFSKLNYEHIT